MGGGSGVLANVGTGRETSVNQLFASMAAITGFQGPPRYLPARPGEVRRSALDPGLLARLLGWTAETPLSSGLEQTIAWVQTQLDAAPTGDLVRQT